MNGIGSASRMCPSGAAGVFVFGTDACNRGAPSNMDCWGIPDDEDACTEAIICVGEGRGEPGLAVADVFLCRSGCFEGRDGAEMHARQDCAETKKSGTVYQHFSASFHS